MFKKVTGGFVSKFLGHQQDEEVTNEHHSSTNPRPTSTDDDAEINEFNRVSGEEEIARSVSSASVVDLGSKRGREDDYTMRFERASKGARSKASSTNLEPDYSVPSDATLIPTPTYNFQEDWRPSRKDLSPPQYNSGMAREHKHRGAILPVNTLDQPVQQAKQLDSRGARRRVFEEPRIKGSYQVEAGEQKTKQSGQLATARIIGSNINPKVTLPCKEDDDHAYNDQRPRKRPKTHNADPVWASDDLSTDPIHKSFTRADEFFGKPTARTQDGIQKEARGQIRRNAQEDQHSLTFEIFESTLNESNDKLRYQPKKTRVQNHSNRSSTSKNSTPDSIQAGVWKQGTRNKPFAVDDDDDKPTAIEVAKQNIKPGHAQTDISALPLINLDDGLDTVEATFRRRQRQNPWVRAAPAGEAQESRQEGRLVDELPQDAVQKRPGRLSEIPSLRALEERQTGKYDNHLGPVSHPAWFNKTEAKRRPQMSQNGLRMAKTFRRDDVFDVAPVRAIGDSSRSPSARIDFDTDDELAGGTNIASPSARKASSRRTAQSLSYKSPSSRNQRQSVQSMQSNQNTLLTPSSRLTSKGIRESKVLDSEHERVENDNHIPIVSIFCKAFSADDARLALVWDDTLGVFNVERGDQRIYLPDRSAPLTIGKADARHGWIGNETALQVMLKGSALITHSTGIIILQFLNSDGMSRCFAFLDYALNNGWRRHEITKEDMNKLFNKQRQDLQSAHEKFAANCERMARGYTLVKERAHNLKKNAQVDDAIRYEPDEPQRGQRASSRLRASLGASTMTEAPRYASHQQRQNEADHLEMISPYFPEPRRSTRNFQFNQNRLTSPIPSPPEKWTQIHKPPAWSHSVVYPAQGLRRVTVEFTDLERLDEGEFLNDNVVNFELRHIEEHMTPEHRQKVHFFNTFFYSTLTTKGTKRAFNYDAVKRWTKNTDLFNIPYVIIPINADLHWFVAIICNLHNLQRKCTAFDGERDENANVMAENLPETDAPDDTVDCLPNSEGMLNDLSNDKIIPESPSTVHGEGSSAFDVRDDMTLDKDAPQQSMHDSPRAKKSKRKAPPPLKYDPDAPIIISMDSFGIARSVELKYLKQYVSEEAKARRGIDNVGVLKGMTAKGLPIQPNFCDCGVYLCGYIAEFAKDPDDFVHRILQRQTQSNEFVEFDPSVKRNEIRDKILSNQKEQSIQRATQKKARAAMKKAQAATQGLFGRRETSPSTATDIPASSSIQDAVQPSTVRGPRSDDVSKHETPSHRAGELQCPGEEERDLEVVAPLALERSVGHSSKSEQSNDEMLSAQEDDLSAVEDRYELSNDDDTFS